MQLDVMLGSQDELWVHFNGVGVVSSEFKPIGHKKQMHNQELICITLHSFHTDFYIKLG